MAPGIDLTGEAGNEKVSDIQTHEYRKLWWVDPQLKKP